MGLMTHYGRILQSMSTGILMKVGYVPEHIECLDECFDEREGYLKGSIY
jgi:hypothetical protein